MQLSQCGVELLKRLEGLRLDAYQDSGGVWTIGYGDTFSVQPGDRITEADADRRLRGRLHDFERGVSEAVRVSLHQHQFDALVLFAYNVGLTAFRQSTLLRRLNEGDLTAAAQQFGEWVLVGGRVLRGLVRRRVTELVLFTTGATAA